MQPLTITFLYINTTSIHLVTSTTGLSTVMPTNCITDAENSSTVFIATSLSVIILVLVIVIIIPWCVGDHHSNL